MCVASKCVHTIRLAADCWNKILQLPGVLYDNFKSGKNDSYFFFPDFLIQKRDRYFVWGYNPNERLLRR